MAKDSMTFKLFGQDVSLSKAFKTAGKASKDMAKDSKNSLKGIGSGVGGLGLAAGIGAVGAFGAKSVGAFETAGKSALTMQRYMGGSIEDASRLGHAFTMTGLDTETAAKSMGILSKHIGTNDKAAQSLGIALKDQNGQLKPMGELLPQISDKFAKMQSGPEKTALALKLFGKSGMTMMPFLNKGSAGIKALTEESDKLGTTLTTKDVQAVKDSTANKRKMGEAVKGLQISIGKELLPMIVKFVSFLTERVVPAISGVVHWMQEHKALVTIVGGVLGGLIVGLGAFVKIMQVVKAVTGAWTIAQNLLNLSFLANPITWIVLGVVALVAAIIIAYKKSETFRNIVDGAFKAVLGAVKAVWNWVKNNWPLLLAIITGPIGIAVLLITRNWDKIKDGAKKAVKWVTDKFGGLVTFFKSLPAKITSAVSSIWDGFKSGFIAMVNFLIDAWNAIDFGINISIPDWIPVIGGKGINIDDILPDIPRLAMGGIVTSPTLALIGEAGPEAVVPLGRGGIGSTVININPVVMAGTEDVMARAIVKSLNDYQRRGGRLQFLGA
jgi:hypothetical protein